MRLYEWEAKALLADVGVPLPRGRRVESGAEARRTATELGPVVLKAQVLHGGRMKAGLVRFADTPDEAAAIADELLAAAGPAGSGVLVEERVEIAEELFLGVLYDPELALPVVVLSRAGGIDVEDNAGEAARAPVDPHEPVPSFRIRGLAAAAGLRGRDLRAVTQIGESLVRAFLANEATLLEVNPLARLADGRLLALDAHVALDGDAAFRHPELVARFALEDRSENERPPTPLELEAKAIDELDHRGVAGRLIQFDGDLALIVGGGGASLTVFDAIRAVDGKPANYCEVGGNPSVRKVEAFTRLLLERLEPRGIAVVMNVVSNTRADLVARGVIKACLAVGRDPAATISVFRVPGAWEDDSRELLAHYGIDALDRSVGIDEAARLAVTRASAA